MRYVSKNPGFPHRAACHTVRRGVYIRKVTSCFIYEIFFNVSARQSPVLPPPHAGPVCNKKTVFTVRHCFRTFRPFDRRRPRRVPFSAFFSSCFSPRYNNNAKKKSTAHPPPPPPPSALLFTTVKRYYGAGVHTHTPTTPRAPVVVNVNGARAVSRCVIASERLLHA